MDVAYKRFKDPIYGYIKIDEKIVKNVIDTPEFQRLRDVIQTSYMSLYSSAVHNRFVHSLGVYYLGKIAADSFISSLRKDSLSIFPDYKKHIQIFELACLLHDVGHAPFSHTGEGFYLEGGDRAGLHKELIKLTKDSELEEEIIANSYKAAPHELMSAIVALRVFKKQIPVKYRSFFARCIIGYKYVNTMTPEKSCKNCLIELLNSKIIDVDKLDYLLRDSYMTGFDTVKIDYARLLDNICAVKDKSNHYRICYNKAAVSVIENVVYAHDAERKWIQTHPIVLYESDIIERTIETIMRTIIQEEKLPYEVLSEEGILTEKNGRIRLMGDSDIIYLMKNLEDKSLAEEYYNRNIRKHPLWKTESEFQAIFQGYELELSIIEAEFENLRTHLRSLGLPFVINDSALVESKAEVEELKDVMETQEGLELEKTQATLKEKEQHIEWMKIFEEFAQKEGIKFEFLVLYANQFNSGFRKSEFGNIEVVFPELKNPCKFKGVTNVLTAEKSKCEKFFFLYHVRKKADEKGDIRLTELIQNMLKLAQNIQLERTTADRLR